jgi:hypothetical protein
MVRLAPLRICSFNLLADGLSFGEFFCEGGDVTSTVWAKRQMKLVSILANILQQCDVVVTQENDHFFSIFRFLRDFHNLNVGGVYGINAQNNISAARSLSVHRRFLQLTSNNHNSPSSKDSTHEEHYQKCNSSFYYSGFDSSCLSYEQECGEYAFMYSKVYGDSPSDLFRSDDGIGIYYCKDKLELCNVSVSKFSVEGRSPLVVSEFPLQQDDVTMVTSLDGFLVCEFRVVNIEDSNIPDSLPPQPVPTPPSHCDFTLYGGHLKSGESQAMEHIRVQQLASVFAHAESKTVPIIAMDSNNSVWYEQSYSSAADKAARSPSDVVNADTPATSDGAQCLSELVAACGYLDAVAMQSAGCEAAGGGVGEEGGEVGGAAAAAGGSGGGTGSNLGTRGAGGNECFKMRHGGGGQASKHFQLMFDCIDKILVRAPKTSSPAAAAAVVGASDATNDGAHGTGTGASSDAAPVLTPVVRVLPVPYDRHAFGFERYDPALGAELLSLRLSERRRSELQRLCRSLPALQPVQPSLPPPSGGGIVETETKTETETVTETEVATSTLCTTTTTTTTAPAQQQQRVAAATTQGGGDTADASASAAVCPVQAFGRTHPLAGLYPNPRAPSDHPPVWCSLEIPVLR